MLNQRQIKTEIPGPKSQELMRRREGAVSGGIGIATPVFVAEASGAQLTDVDGNVFLDFAGGIGVMNVGHSEPRVVEAIKEQAEKFTHTCFYVNHYEPYVELAEKLNSFVPGSSQMRSAFFNSGAEAVENAVKAARYYTGRDAVLAFENAFHGRTYMAMSLTSKVNPYKKGFAPFVPEVYRVTAPYPYRCPSGRDCSNGCQQACFSGLDKALVGGADPENVAAVIIEPVSGEGGFIPMPDDFLRRVREFCDEHGIVMIVDEVQSGFARTGKMLAIEHSGVEPDIVTTAKSLGAGMPIAGVTGKAEIMDSVHPGGLGTTYGGNPLACAAALAAIQTIEEDGLLESADHLGERTVEAMHDLQNRYPELVGDVRAKGAMVAMELVTDAESKTPNKALTAAVVEHALQKGLLLLTAGQYGNVIRVLAPLVITGEQLQEALQILSEAFEEAASAA
jgi:4-aminobutyrate aminotransferase/(S)-3-amino-2-methylpropionate transaminase